MKPAVAHAYVAGGLVLVALYFTQSDLTAELIRDTVTLTAIGAIIIGIRRNRPRNRRAWYLALFGVLLILARHVCWIVNLINGVPVEGKLGDLFGVAGYLMFTGSVLLIVRHRTRGDAGGVLDAAVLALASATVIWEFLMFGKLTDHDVGTVPLTVKLIQLLCLMGGLGVLLRLAQTTATSPASLLYLFGVVLGAFVRVVGYTIVSDSAVYEPGGWTDAGSMVALLCLGAAALHPSMTQLTEPGPPLDDRLSPRRLWLLAVALLAGPLSVGIFLLAGGKADTVLLVVGSVAIVPLVMLRIRGLVAQRASAEAALAHQALHDSLTGLPNRAHFVSQLQGALDRVRTGASASVAVVFCDLDGFKAVNDALGHSVGDEVLATVAQRLRNCVRDGDVVSRFGGDEFLILSENLSEAEVADRIVDRIYLQMSPPITLGKTQVMISASVGVAASTAKGEQSAEDIIRNADIAMYAAKQSSSTPPQVAATGARGS